jgi:hypothetical protein
LHIEKNGIKFPAICKTPVCNRYADPEIKADPGKGQTNEAVAVDNLSTSWNHNAL